MGVGGFHVGVDIGVCATVGTVMFIGLGVWAYYIVATIGLYGIVGIWTSTKIVCKIMGT